MEMLTSLFNMVGPFWPLLPFILFMAFLVLWSPTVKNKPLPKIAPKVDLSALNASDLEWYDQQMAIAGHQSRTIAKSNCKEYLEWQFERN